MLEYFLIYPTSEGAREMPIEGNKISLGRGSEADLRFADEGLSRLHSTIYREGGAIWIADENSTNGTFVNGKKTGGGGKPLRDGDSIQIGNHTILRITAKENTQIKENMQINYAEISPINLTNTAVESSSSQPNALGILPVAISAIAIFVISVSAVFIGFKFWGKSEPEVITASQNSKDEYYGISTDEPEDTPTPEPDKTPKPVKSVSSALSGAENTKLTESPESKSQNLQSALPAGKQYLQMSEDEKRQYIQAKAEKVAALIGNSAGNAVTPLAVDRIKGFLDAYAKRANVSKMSGCRFGDNLQATYERASKNAPFIIRAFNERNVDPQIGLYLAMIESEHCVCLQSPTGPLGMFQFTYLTAKAHFRATDSIIKGASPANPDDRCKPEPAAHAAAEYMKFLTGRYGTGPASVPLAIGSYNSGEGGLSKNLQTALNSNESLPRDFWTLIANGDKLSKQFQAENFKYVPKFFAAAIVGENPKDFGLNLQSLSTYTQ